MDTALWVVIEIDEYFNIPINQFNSNPNNFDFDGMNRPFGYSYKMPNNLEPKFPSPLGVSPSDPNPFFEPPNFIRRAVSTKPLPDIKLVGIYASKEEAQNMVLGHPRRKVLGPKMVS